MIIKLNISISIPADQGGTHCTIVKVHGMQRESGNLLQTDRNEEIDLKKAKYGCQSPIVFPMNYSNQVVRVQHFVSITYN